MLSFDIRAIDAAAAAVDGELSADDEVWQEGDPRPAGSVLVTGRLSTAGPGRYYFSGHIEGTATGECRRCLEPASAGVSAESHLIFTEAGVEEADEADDAYLLEPGTLEIDLRPAVREEWLLTAPSLMLCREDCKGLCPNCGADLNTGPCECAPAVDPRWDALRADRGASK
jgi:uncharacterized protein